jgi:hypothetical protein
MSREEGGVVSARMESFGAHENVVAAPNGQLEIIPANTSFPLSKSNPWPGGVGLACMLLPSSVIVAVAFGTLEGESFQ